MSHFKASERATNTHNLIGRAIRELRLPENFHKPTYSFAAGDPTLCPDF